MTSYESLWLRAVEGARTANKGIRRLQARCDRLEEEIEDLLDDLDIERGRAERAEGQARTLADKVERLSLMIIDLWARAQKCQEH